MELNELLGNKSRHCPGILSAMDNDKLIPTIRLFGRRQHNPAKTVCLGRLDSALAMAVMAATLRMRCRTWSGRSTFCWQTNDAPGPSCHAASFTSAKGCPG